MRKIYLFFILLPLLGSCQKQKEEIQFPIYHEFEITHHNYYEIGDYEISWHNIFNVEKEIYYVYFYSTTCSHCADLKDWIIEKAIERKDIYFVKSSENDIIVKDVSSTIGAKTPEEMAILGYPTVVKIVDGTLVNNSPGKSNIQKLLNL